jgi:nucleoside-diphosphate-sugar epimerase
LKPTSGETNLVARSDAVLITGGSGFTGRPLAERLREDGYDVTAVGRGAGGADAVNMDLCNLDGLIQLLSRTQPASIVHLAGISAPSHGNIGEIYTANVIGTANLFAAIERAKLEPRIVIVASSAQLYAPAGEDGSITEEGQLRAKNHYAVSKHATEEISRLYSRKFPIIITRPFNYTGPGQGANFLVPKIVHHYAERRSEIRLGNLDLFRDFSDIDRAVEAYARLVTLPVNSTTVNICSGRAVHLLDILEIMRDLSGHQLRIVSDPTLVRADEPRTLIGSPARLESMGGNLPNPAFRDTLTRMYNAFRKPNINNVAERET